jgi:hypothetical protein
MSVSGGDAKLFARVRSSTFICPKSLRVFLHRRISYGAYDRILSMNMLAVACYSTCSEVT